MSPKPQTEKCNFDTPRVILKFYRKASDSWGPPPKIPKMCLKPKYFIVNILTPLSRYRNPMSFISRKMWKSILRAKSPVSI